MEPDQPPSSTGGAVVGAVVAAVDVVVAEGAVVVGAGVSSTGVDVALRNSDGATDGWTFVTAA